jgi:hypothetical protein
MKAHEDLAWALLESRLQEMAGFLESGDMDAVKLQLQALVSGYCCTDQLPSPLQEDMQTSRNVAQAG